MRERLPLLLTLGVLLAVGGGLAVRRGSWFRREPARAEERLAAVMAAASRGDARAYLAGFSGPLQEALRRAAAESGQEAFGEGLRRRHREMTGWAMSRTGADGDAGAVTLRVEAVFRDRTETQDHELRLEGGTWRITRLGTAQVTRMPIAYGTPVGAEPGAATAAGDAGAQGPP